MATINYENYTLGGIDVYFEASVGHADLLSGTPVGDNFRTGTRNLGNIVSAEFNPETTNLEHWISVRGSRKKDAEQIMTKSLTIPVVFDEINENNMKRFFMASSLGNNKLAVMEQPLIYGSVSLYVNTDIGTSMVYSIPKATIKPDGAMALNTEDWWTGPMSIDVQYHDTGQWASKPYGVLEVV
jgi:hypothetical protein